MRTPCSLLLCLTASSLVHVGAQTAAPFLFFSLTMGDVLRRPTGSYTPLSSLFHAPPPPSPLSGLATFSHSLASSSSSSSSPTDSQFSNSPLANTSDLLNTGFPSYNSAQTTPSPSSGSQHVGDARRLLFASDRWVQTLYSHQHLQQQQQWPQVHQQQHNQGPHQHSLLGSFNPSAQLSDMARERDQAQGALVELRYGTAPCFQRACSPS